MTGGANASFALDASCVFLEQLESHRFEMRLFYFWQEAFSFHSSKGCI